MKYQELKIFAGKYSPPIHEIFIQKISIQNVFDQNIFICQTIFKNVAAHFATN